MAAAKVWSSCTWKSKQLNRSLISEDFWQRNQLVGVLSLGNMCNAFFCIGMMGFYCLNTKWKAWYQYFFFWIHEGMTCSFEKAQLQRNYIVQWQSLHFGGGGRFNHHPEQRKQPFLEKQMKKHVLQGWGGFLYAVTFRFEFSSEDTRAILLGDLTVSHISLSFWFCKILKISWSSSYAIGLFLLQS